MKVLYAKTLKIPMAAVGKMRSSVTILGPWRHTRQPWKQLTGWVGLRVNSGFRLSIICAGNAVHFYINKHLDSFSQAFCCCLRPSKDGKFTAKDPSLSFLLTHPPNLSCQWCQHSIQETRKSSSLVCQCLNELPTCRICVGKEEKKEKGTRQKK